jgi:hypothetical protein
MSNLNAANVSIMPLDEVLTGGNGKPTTAGVLRTIEGQHVTVSSQVAEFAARKKSLLARIFPIKLDQVLADAQLNAARTDCDLNQRILELACTMKYEACRETADTWVKSLKVENRGEFFKFVSERLLALGQTIEKRRIEFGTHMKQRYVQVDAYADMPEFQQRYKRSIETEVDATLDWLDELLQRFRSIVQERVVQYDQTALPIK